MSNPLAWIIEDDPNQAEIFANALQMADYDIEVIADGALALSKVTMESPDLVVLDLHLPTISGPEILDQIRSEPHLKGTRVIVATADPRLVDTMEVQGVVVLIKPVSFRQLRDLAVRFRSIFTSE